MLIKGKCHCGNIAFSLTWDPDPVEIPARACDCTFCTKHGGLYTSNPNGSLKVAIEDASRVSKYTFGTGTADFIVCSNCGVVPVVTSTIDGNTYAVVSVNAFQDVPASLLRRTPASFGAETEATRLARRQRNWIGKVEFVRSLDA
jgi:hypothetical protein